MRILKFRVWYEKPEWERDGKSQYVPKGAFVHSVYVEKPIADDVYTYEQFTGLLDKNGKEIYEGDIVKATYRETPQLVEWRQNYAGFSIAGVWSQRPVGSESTDWEIIGNIHENPELIPKV